MIDRKRKEAEFFAEHKETFKKLKLHDPFFTIKTAFYKKGKEGRQVQFFEWELEKGADIYVEFYDYEETSHGKDMVPMYESRNLFKYTYNPFFKEEYDTKSNVNKKGEEYITYIIPVSELSVVLKDGNMITYPDFEAGNYTEPQEQSKISIFPDFEQELGLDSSSEDAPFSEMTIKDFCAVMLRKPVSDKKWLNNLIKNAKYGNSTS